MIDGAMLRSALERCRGSGVEPFIAAYEVQDDEVLEIAREFAMGWTVDALKCILTAQEKVKGSGGDQADVIDAVRKMSPDVARELIGKSVAVFMSGFQLGVMTAYDALGAEVPS